eukprot:5230505-Ditylum_brightwellii.AAC.1
MYLLAVSKPFNFLITDNTQIMANIRKCHRSGFNNFAVIENSLGGQKQVEQVLWLAVLLDETVINWKRSWKEITVLTADSRIF